MIRYQEYYSLDSQRATWLFGIVIRLIVGLGNPGSEYTHTRHNLGFMVADAFISKRRGKYTEIKADYQLATLRIKGQHIYVAKPQTFMNLSGQAVGLLLKHLEIDRDDLLVIADDFALPYGKLRLRKQGSDGGHNGLASVIEEMGSEEFARLRMGIGPCPEGVAFEEYVLQEFSHDQLDELEDFVKLGVSCIESVLYTGLDAAMNKYNGL